MDEQREKYVTNEQAQATARVVAVIIFAVGSTIAYLVWPSGITGLALAAITFGALLRAIAAAVIEIAAFIVAAMLWIE